MKTPKTKPARPEPAEDEIRRLAHHLWIEGGCLEGVELENWHAAKARLRHRPHPAPGATLPPPDQTGPDPY